MLFAEAHPQTGHASRYISQLCKHWSHKFEVEFDAEHGLIALPLGPCRLNAEPGALTLRVEAQDEESLSRLEDVVARHLERFAFREELKIVWGPTQAI